MQEIQLTVKSKIFPLRKLFVAPNVFDLESDDVDNFKTRKSSFSGLIPIVL